MIEAFLGLGTNLGDREAHLAQAVTLLEQVEGLDLQRVSQVYRTSPWGVTDQPDFLNICVQARTSLSPGALLRAGKWIETALGRAVRTRWGPREIDVDILLMEDVDIDTPDLTIPHPQMAARRFVLEPLSELAPDHVLDGVTVGDLARYLRQDAPDQACVPDAAATQRLAELREAFRAP